MKHRPAAIFAKGVDINEEQNHAHMHDNGMPGVQQSRSRLLVDHDALQAPLFGRYRAEMRIYQLCIAVIGENMRTCRDRGSIR